MLLEIEPLHDPKKTCTQDLIVSVSKFWDLRFELMYARAWGFSYDSVSTEEFTVGDKIDPQFESALDLLKKYHGLEVRWGDTATSSKLHGLIRGELTTGYPIGIYMNIFWLPWENGYQVHHREHFIMAVGYIAEEQSLICIDPMYGLEKKTLSVHHFLEGNNGTFFSFRQVEVQQNMNVVDFQDIVRKQLYPKGKQDTFSAIEELALDIDSERFDMNREVELDNSGIIWLSPIVWNLIKVEKGRHCFSSALLEMAKILNEDRYEVLASEIVQAGVMWESVRAMLIKLYYSKSLVISQFKGRIADKLKEIASFERSIADQLLNEDTAKYIEDKDQPRVSSKLPTIDEDCPEERLILVSFYNCYGFGGFQSGASFTNVIGNEHFVIEETFSQSSYWSVGLMEKYDLPEIDQVREDHVSCLGQRLPLPQRPIRSMTFLGCSEWGAFSEDMLFVLEDNSTKAMKVMFPDWSSPGEFDDVAWKGKTIIYEEIGEINYKIRYLYTITVELPTSITANYIQLPLCPNIHILSININ